MLTTLESHELAAGREVPFPAVRGERAGRCGGRAGNRKRPLPGTRGGGGGPGAGGGGPADRPRPAAPGPARSPPEGEPPPPCQGESEPMARALRAALLRHRAALPRRTVAALSGRGVTRGAAHPGSRPLHGRPPDARAGSGLRRGPTGRQGRGADRASGPGNGRTASVPGRRVDARARTPAPVFEQSAHGGLASASATAGRRTGPRAPYGRRDGGDVGRGGSGAAPGGRGRSGRRRPVLYGPAGPRSPGTGPTGGARPPVARGEGSPRALGHSSSNACTGRWSLGKRPCSEKVLMSALDTRTDGETRIQSMRSPSGTSGP